MTAHPCRVSRGARFVALALAAACLGSVHSARAQDAGEPAEELEPEALGGGSGGAEAPPDEMPPDELPPGLAPSEGEQQEARALFEAGRAAYNEGRLEDAFEHFRRAFELSDEPRLLYNIGTTADRLRRDDVAIESYERYLERIPEASDRLFVKRRIAYLRDARPDEDAAGGGGPDDESTGRGAGHLVGSIGVGAAGLAALGVGIGSFVKGDSCGERDPVTGECRRNLERGDTTAGAIWTVAGAAALGGAVLWLVLSAPDDDTGAGTSVGISPRSVDLRVRF